MLTRQWLDQRFADRATLAHTAAAWETQRNARRVTANWQFTTADARIKLKRLYPLLNQLDSTEHSG